MGMMALSTIPPEASHYQHSPALRLAGLRRSEPPCSRYSEGMVRVEPQRFDRGLVNDRNRRVSPLTLRSAEGLLTEPIAGARPRPQERVLMPLFLTLPERRTNPPDLSGKRPSRRCEIKTSGFSGRYGRNRRAVTSSHHAARRGVPNRPSLH